MEPRWKLPREKVYAASRLITVYSRLWIGCHWMPSVVFIVSTFEFPMFGGVWQVEVLHISLFEQSFLVERLIIKTE